MVETVLVTGGTGFIALEVIHQLLTSGTYKVRATVRNVDNAERNQPLLDLCPGAKNGPVELVQADLMSDAGWQEAVDGVDYVLHTASPFFIGTKEEQFVGPAVEGTLRVLHASSAESSKVKRVVVTSSVAAIAYGQDDKDSSYVFTEADWTVTDKVDPYTKSKTLAEKAAWDFVATNDGHKFELTTINPALVVGHCRTTPGTSVDIIQQVMSAKMPMIPDMRLGVVDVVDVATAHVAALSAPKAAGERFLLSAGVMKFTEIADTLAELFPDVRVATRRMPKWLAQVLSPFVAQMRAICRGWGHELHLDGSKATTVLGVKYQDLRESLKQTGDSLIEAKLVTPIAK